jgi:uncharacterized protein (DUF1697 family)
LRGRRAVVVRYPSPSPVTSDRGYKEMSRKKDAVTSNYVALIRGINVGRAKRVAMTELRALVAQLGYGGVRTLLNSGNVVFSAAGVDPHVAAAQIEQGLAARLGVAARVIVLTAAEVLAALEENPLADVATDPSRLLIAVLVNPKDRSLLEPLGRMDWSPEVLAIGARVAYLWCPDGVLASRLAEAVGRTLRGAVTTRNWATWTRLHALAESPQQ